MKTALAILVVFVAMIDLRAEDNVVVNRIAAIVNGRTITMKDISRRAEKEVLDFLEQNGNRREDPEVLAGARMIVRAKLQQAINDALIDDHVRRLKNAERAAWLNEFEAKDDVSKFELYERFRETANVQILVPRLREPEANRPKEGQQGVGGQPATPPRVGD